MNIMHKEIEHILFGKGKVISQDVDRLSVRFSERYGTKLFIYPDAFEKYLKLHDFEIEMSVMEELHAKQARIEAEKTRKYQEYELALKAQRPSSPRSRAAKPKGKSNVSKKAGG